MATNDKAVDFIAHALRLLGQAYRGDWSDFDGRTLRDELNELADALDKALAGEEFDLERWQIRLAICGECWCWFENCPGHELD